METELFDKLLEFSSNSKETIWKSFSSENLVDSEIFRIEGIQTEVSFKLIDLLPEPQKTPKKPSPSSKKEEEKPSSILNSACKMN